MDDLISRQAAIELAMQYCPDDDGTCSKADEVMRNLLDELEDLPSAQLDGIPLEWIDKHLEWLDNCDNDFAQLAKVNIKSMVELWKKDRALSADRRRLKRYKAESEEQAN